MSSWLSGGDKTRTNVRVYGDTTYTHLPPSIVVTLPAGRYSTLGTAQCVHSQCRAQGRLIELQGPQCLEDVVEHHGDDALATQLRAYSGEPSPPGFVNGHSSNPRSHSKKLIRYSLPEKH